MIVKLTKRQFADEYTNPGFYPVLPVNKTVGMRISVCYWTGQDWRNYAPDLNGELVSVEDNESEKQDFLIVGERIDLWISIEI